MEVNLLLYDLKEAKKYWLKLSMANIKKQDANNETNQPKKNTETNQPKKKSKLLPIIVIFLLIIIGLLAFILWKIWNTPKEDDSRIGGTGIVISNDSNPNIKQELESKVKEGMFTVKMNTTWDFPTASEASSNAYVANSVNNRNTVYFEVTLKDSEKLIYTSPDIPVNHHINSIKLDETLDKGTYSAIVKYYMLDTSGNVVDSVSVGITINILN